MRTDTTTTPSNMLLTMLPGRYLILANVIWPSFFIPLTFLLYFLADSYELDEIRGVKQIPTISSSGALSPYSVLLTYGLHMEGILIACIFTCIYVRYREKIDGFTGKMEIERHAKEEEEVEESGNHQKWRFRIFVIELTNCGCCCQCTKLGCLSRPPRSKAELHHWNWITFCFGLIASFLMTLVGSITLDLNEIAHSTFAFFMFLFGILHMYFFYYKITKILFRNDETQQWRVFLHQVCIFVSFPFNIAMFILAGVVYATCSSLTCQRFSIDLLPATEFSTVIALLLYITQFYEDVKDVNILALANRSEVEERQHVNPLYQSRDSEEVKRSKDNEV